MSQPMKLTAIAAGMLLLGLTGNTFAQSANTPAGSARSHAANSARQAGSSDAADNAFMKKAAADGMAEVAMGRMALTKSKDAEVKQLAQRIVSDHTKADNELKSIAQDKNVKLPTSPDASERKTSAALEKKSGTAFDKAWTEHMVTDHKKAIALFTKTSNDANADSDVRNFAQQTLPVLRNHLEMAQSLAGGQQ